ncbi:MAG: CPXCG motif-containing cysteine-rich protein [Pseudomonadales bacterium]|nr:CPXCG motif-containing cysteine-rich protein [Pseudomonadales bacterium]MBO6565327.1 CPXCG motif-containing cysteine-rich protein [Pseudomonadales bacterium]MBO6597899.1 CPXCG motif-containing cysteine-rich protein [Pseudomonadales bacterium]MBO6657653.1 CPXCG motif-containing cysteine-rich protein [Pseudomonadales bacterium]MBO6702280.1 CPXCG motif-containing cysteine-rich protein [Pseudomonadales bacterium]
MEQRISCPYCGEPLNILLDPTEAGQEYIEDCQVCCRPIVMTLDVLGGDVSVRREDD